MEDAPGTYQYDTIEECCIQRYNYNSEACIIDSGGKLALTAGNEWYVNWEESICVQNCLKDTGEVQYRVTGVSEFYEKFL